MLINGDADCCSWHELAVLRVPSRYDIIPGTSNEASGIPAAERKKLPPAHAATWHKTMWPCAHAHAGAMCGCHVRVRVRVRVRVGVRVRVRECPHESAGQLPSSRTGGLVRRHACVAAERGHALTGSHGCSRAARGAPGHPLQVPWIARHLRGSEHVSVLCAWVSEAAPWDPCMAWTAAVAHPSTHEAMVHLGGRRWWRGSNAGLLLASGRPGNERRSAAALRKAQRPARARQQARKETVEWLAFDEIGNVVVVVMMIMMT